MTKRLDPLFSGWRLTPFAVALLYAFFSFLWIVVSGSWLRLNIDDPVMQGQIELVKGLLFVSVTASMLYLVLRQWRSSLPGLSGSDGQTPRTPEKLGWRILSLGVLAAIVPLAGYVVLRVHQPEVERDAYASLQAIAELKTRQVENWFDERYNDGVVVMSTPGLISQVDAMQKSGDSRLRSDLHAMLGALIKALQYDSALLVDARGNTLLGIGSFEALSTQAQALLPKALASALPMNSEMYIHTDGRSRIDIVVPLIRFGEGLPRPVGAVILNVAPDQFLFPYVEYWPTASASGKSLLVRRDGDSVSVMNELRHGGKDGVSQRYPLSSQGLPMAVVGAGGQPGRIQGADFRGVEVLAAYRPVGGTDWVIVAQQDRDEVLAPVRVLAFWVSLVALLAITAVSVVMLVLWRQRGRALRLEMQVRSDQLLRQFYDLPFIGIAISSPTTNRWLKCNDRLCEILGHAREDLLGMVWTELIHRDDRGANQAALEKIMRGESDGYVLDMRFVRKDGRTVFATVEVKCVRRANGAPEHLFATLQDVTERMLADARIRQLTRIYAALSECNHAIVRCVSQEELFPQICRIAVQLGGMKKAWVALFDRQTLRVNSVASFGQETESVQDIRVSVAPDNPYGQGAVGMAIREGRPVWIDDYVNDPRSEAWHERAAREGWGGVAALPLIRDGHVVGVFVLISGESYPFDEQIRHLLTEMASDISFALDLFAGETERRQMETALRESEIRFRNLYEKAPLAYQSLDIEGNILEVNEAWLVLLGRTREEVIGRFIGDFLSEASIETLSCEFPKFQQTGRVDGPLFHFVHRDGSQRLLMVNGQIARDLEGRFLRTHCILTDLTERHKAEEQLKLAAKVFEQSAEGIIITDSSNVIVMVNRAFSAITGYSVAEVLGRNPDMMASGRHDAAFFQGIWESIAAAGYWHGEIWNRRKDGSVFPSLVSISKVLDADNRVSHFVGIFTDISEHKANEAHIHRLAHFDPLTGLPNRSLLADRVHQSLGRMERNKQTLALIFLDLDRFKNVNDSLGHRIGDQLLIQVAERLKSESRDEDTVSRLGGDEFILVLPGADSDGAAHVAEKVLKSLSLPYRIEEHELIITPSLGIAMYPADGDSYELLSMCADAAMYRAKQAGRHTYRFFTREMQERSERTLQLENALRHVLEARQLQLYFQPQIALDTHRIVGVEALLRWRHPEFGLVSPGDFIPIAEDSGLILPIGEWALRAAVQQMKTWLDAGLAPLAVSVNLSAIQFRRTDLPRLVSSVLDEFGLPPELLELELTEGVAMENPLAAIDIMNALHERGVRMSIDDFGTGYSSLNYLKRFKVCKLKVDQSFVRDISTSPDDAAIVEAIINLSRSLGLKTVAEGVETSEQLAFLRLKGCNEGQGYLFGKPMPAEQFEAYFRAHSPH